MLPSLPGVRVFLVPPPGPSFIESLFYRSSSPRLSHAVRFTRFFASCSSLCLHLLSLMLIFIPDVHEEGVASSLVASYLKHCIPGACSVSLTSFIVIVIAVVVVAVAAAAAAVVVVVVVVVVLVAVAAALVVFSNRSRRRRSGGSTIVVVLVVVVVGGGGGEGRGGGSG